MQYLYIIKCREFHKIGIANDVEARLAQLSTGNPYPLEVQIVYAFENAEVVERAIHQRYKENRQRGEWFTLDYDALKNIHSICLMLGGSAFEYRGSDVTEEVIEDIEETQEALTDEGGKWDYAAMFADGWRMEPADSRGVKGKYWCWRKGGSVLGRKYLYGGTIESLPYENLQAMRAAFSDVAEKADV